MAALGLRNLSTINGPRISITVIDRATGDTQLVNIPENANIFELKYAIAEKFRPEHDIISWDIKIFKNNSSPNTMHNDAEKTLADHGINDQHRIYVELPAPSLHVITEEAPPAPPLAGGNRKRLRRKSRRNRKLRGKKSRKH
jgi:hypothetical protein